MNHSLEETMDRSKLYQELHHYREDIYPMHMPGHKLGRCTNLGEDAVIDVTEVEGTDNLHHSNGILLQAQEKAAKTFGAKKTFFLVGGSTSGILSAVWAICHNGGKIMMSRNAHKSVYNASLLCRLDPIYIYPSLMQENGIAAGIDPSQIEWMLKRNPSVEMVVITSPNYEGMTSDVETIAKMVHDYGKILMVDEAHGAHFPFHNDFPESALVYGADIVIQSTHKTLPAYTQSAMLHVNSGRVDLHGLQDALALFQSSSPSYVLMNGLDSCRDLIDRQGHILFEKYVRTLKTCRKRLASKLSCLKILDEALIGIHDIHYMDPSKFVIDCTSANITGIELDHILRGTYKIQVELAGKNHIIGMTSICDEEDGLIAFTNALIEIDKGLKKIRNTHQNYDIIKDIQQVYKPWHAYSMDKRSVPLVESAGKVVGEFIIPFPPGVPLIVPGERMSEHVIRIVEQYIKMNIEIMGMADDTYGTILIIDEV